MTPSPMVNVRALKFGLPTIAAMICISTSLTSELTTALNATPITTATARSRTFPRMTKSRKSFTRSCILPPVVPPTMRRSVRTSASARQDASEALDDHGHALATAYTHALEPVTAIAVFQAVEERGHDA